MNKAGKIAYSWLKAQSDSEKIRFIAQALGSIEYQAFIKKHQPEKQHALNRVITGPASDVLVN